MTFDTTSELPSALLDIGAGVQVMGDDKHEIRGQYKAQLANDFVNQDSACAPRCGSDRGGA